MPPKAKKRRITSADDQDEVSKLLPWLSRGTLEALVKKSVIEHIPVTMNALKQSLPQNQHWRLKDAPTNVGKGQERVGTGLFDNVDANAMMLILAHLNVRERITCVTSVCKAWREFKSLPGLFCDLSDDSVATVRQDPPCRETRTLKAARVHALLQWVPNPACVTGLRLSTTDGCNPTQCKAIIKFLAEAKKRAKLKMDLSTLVLTGPKIYESVIREAMKKGFGPSLVSLTISDVKDTKPSKMGEGCVLDLFKTCPQLEELHIMQSLVARYSLSATLQSLRTARSGAPTLLRVLDLTNKGYTSYRIDWPDIAAIGSSCPELQVLRLKVVTGIPTSPPHQPQPTPDNFLSEPMAFLPQLKVFSLERVVPQYSDYVAQPEHATSETVARVLSWLFEAMPSIEDFSFGHGSVFLTNTDKKRFTVPPIPGVGNVIWPSTLRKLHLRHLTIEADAFAAASLPILEIATLEFCGPNMLTAIQQLRGHGKKIGVWKLRHYSVHVRNNDIRCFCVANKLSGKFLDLDHLIL